jgi:hypothetical protein
MDRVRCLEHETPLHRLLYTFILRCLGTAASLLEGLPFSYEGNCITDHNDITEYIITLVKETH